MEGGSQNPDDLIRRIAEAGKGVRFGRGVVGKTSHVVIAVVAMWAVIVWRLGDDLTLNAALIVAGCIGTGVFVWWTKSTQTFAERNPAQAMLEGAQFIEYKRFEAEVKGIPGNSQIPRIEADSTSLPKADGG